MEEKLSPGEPAPDFVVTAGGGERLRLSQLRGRPVALVFSRHLGCPICRDQLATLARRREELARCGVDLIVFVRSPADRVEAWVRRHVPPFHLVADPHGKVYAEYGIRGGSPLGLLSPGALMATLRALAHGHRHGRFEGDELQKPADFVVDAEGRLTHTHIGAHVGDGASVDRLLEACGCH